jgi:hypothetical protein
VANVVDDRFKTMQLNISGVKAFSAHPTSISRYLAADLQQMGGKFAVDPNPQ